MTRPRSAFGRSLVSGLGLCSLLLVACADPGLSDPDPDPIDLPPGIEVQDLCSSDAPTAHRTATLTGSHVWPAEASPHWVLEPIRVAGRLTIEAGATVCALPDAGLELDTGGELIVSGTAHEPVRLTAIDPAHPWPGIGPAFNARDPRATLLHVVLEYAETGVRAHEIVIEHSRLRAIRGSAVHVHAAVGDGLDPAPGHGRLTSTVIDTACAVCDWTDSGGGDAAVLVAELEMVLEDVVIRGSGAHGVRVRQAIRQLGEVGRLTLRGVRIEGSAGIGLVLASDYPWGKLVVPRLDQTTDVRIMGGGSYAAVVAGEEVHRLIPDAAARANLLGNATEGIVVKGPFEPGEVVVPGGLPWFIGIDPRTGTRSFVLPDGLRLEPGAMLIGGHVGVHGARVSAEGAADEPVVLIGVTLRVSGEGESALSHLRVENGAIEAWDEHRVSLRHMVAERSHIELAAPLSLLARARVTGAVCTPTSRHQAAVILAGAGSRMEHSVVAASECDGVLVLGPDVELTTCTVSGHEGAGVRVTGGTGLRIRDCNLVENAAPGVLNETTALVDARGNWWGDPAGPDGPDGDGVQGPVDHAEPLGAPVPVEP